MKKRVIGSELDHLYRQLADLNLTADEMKDAFLSMLTNRRNTMTTSMISAEHLTYKRNRHLILDDLNLNVHQGHFIGLLGANGAGRPP